MLLLLLPQPQLLMLVLLLLPLLHGSVTVAGHLRPMLQLLQLPGPQLLVALLLQLLLAKLVPPLALLLLLLPPQQRCLAPAGRLPQYVNWRVPTRRLLQDIHRRVAARQQVVSGRGQRRGVRHVES